MRGCRCMGELALTALVPHPPIIVPAVGGGRGTSACHCGVDEGFGRAFREAGVESIVIISPHSTLFSDAIVLRRRQARWRPGSVQGGAGSDELRWRRRAGGGHMRRGEAPGRPGIRRRCAAAGPRHHRADIFIGQELPDVRLVPVSMGLGPADQLYARHGRCRGGGAHRRPAGGGGGQRGSVSQVEG